MIYAWLAKRSLGLARGLWVVIAIVALIGGWTWWRSSEAEKNREAGALNERNTQLERTITRAGTAKETRDAIERDIDAGGSDELYAQCMRSARTPANCQRFLPGRSTAQR